MARTWRFYCTDCDAEEVRTFPTIEEERPFAAEWCRQHGYGARFTPMDSASERDISRGGDS